SSPFRVLRSEENFHWHYGTEWGYLLRLIFGLRPLDLNDDVSTNSPVVSRFLQVEAAHHCAVFQPHARFAEPSVHERRHELIRPRFYWPEKSRRQQIGGPCARPRHFLRGHS